MRARALAAVLGSALLLGGCSELGRGEPLVTQAITDVPEAQIDLSRAREENQLRLIDPLFEDVRVLEDRWGIESARLFFNNSTTLIVAENSDPAVLRAASLSVAQRVPMVVYDSTVRAPIIELAEDLGVEQVVVIGQVPLAVQAGETTVIHDPGNTKALGEYTAFQFTSQLVSRPERMVNAVAHLDAANKTELKAAWEPLSQHITKEKMPAIPAQARRDSQMAPVIVATAETPVANVANANAYGGSVIVLKNPDPSATKAGAAVTAGLEEGPIVALGPEFGSAKEFSSLIARGRQE
ncbi:hypothetical protein [Corynebacterium sp.]|uniref:hypothetical protein n=1 Tax=Corynebacterium sp. TaxID=1720 RepID=UPI0026DD6AB4|nr:hypothetical protein [Corynebacterium sp.]MDO5031473.1 hypothetical protein [Corynebacterium sp.]